MKKKTVQVHHIEYNPERVVALYRGEHRIVTLTQWMKYPSKGFIEAERFELDRLAPLAVELPVPTPEEQLQRKKDRRKWRNAKRRTKKEKAKRPKVSRNLKRSPNWGKIYQATNQ